jgi:hypothetical protein
VAGVFVAMTIQPENPTMLQAQLVDAIVGVPPMPLDATDLAVVGLGEGFVIGNPLHLQLQLRHPRVVGDRELHVHGDVLNAREGVEQCDLRR